MNSAAVIGRQLRQQNRAPGPLAVPGRPRAPSHVNLGPLPASVTAAAGSSPHKDSSANKNQEEEDKQHSLIPAYVSLGCVWKFAKALTPGVLLIAIGTAMCVVGFLAEQLSTTVVVIDSANNETSTMVNRSMEYHLHNLSFAGPAIMGLGGICIVAACVLTFGVKDHHHRVVPVDEKRPSIGEALVPILPLPPKGRRKPKPPADTQAATASGGSGSVPQNCSSTAAATIGQTVADDSNSVTGKTTGQNAGDPWSRPASGAHSTSNPHQLHVTINTGSTSCLTTNATTSNSSSKNRTKCSTAPSTQMPPAISTVLSLGQHTDTNGSHVPAEISHSVQSSHNDTSTNAYSSGNNSVNSRCTTFSSNPHETQQQVLLPQQQQQQQQHKSSNSGVAGNGGRKSSVAAGSKTTIVPTRSSEAHRASVSTDKSTINDTNSNHNSHTRRSSSVKMSSNSSSSMASKPVSATACRTGTPLQVASPAVAPEGGALSAYTDLVHPDYRAYPDYPERYLAGSALSAAALGDTGSGCSTPASNLSLPPLGSTSVWTCPMGDPGGQPGPGGLPLSVSCNPYNKSYPAVNSAQPGAGQTGGQLAGRSSYVGQASPYSSSNSNSNYSGAPPSSLSFVPLHMRSGANPPFKMRPAPSLSTSSTCTNFLLSPQYEATFIPSPTDLQILDPDGCETPSSSKSFYMSRSASASSGLHLDMYLSRLPVSLRMQLSSKLFASMESDGLSSMSTSENDIAANSGDAIVLRDFSRGMKRTSFNSAVSKVGNSRTSTEDSQEVTPLLADDESPMTADTTPGSLGGGIGGCGVPSLMSTATVAGHAGGGSCRTGMTSHKSADLFAVTVAEASFGGTTTTASAATPTRASSAQHQRTPQQIPHPLQTHPMLSNSSSPTSFDRRFPLLRQAATENSRTLNGKMASANVPSNQISQLLPSNYQPNSCTPNSLGDNSPTTGVAISMSDMVRSISPLRSSNIATGASTTLTTSSLTTSAPLSSIGVVPPTNNNASDNNSIANRTANSNNSSSNTTTSRTSSVHALHHVPS